MTTEPTSDEELLRLAREYVDATRDLEELASRFELKDRGGAAVSIDYRERVRSLIEQITELANLLGPDSVHAARLRRCAGELGEEYLT